MRRFSFFVVTMLVASFSAVGQSKLDLQPSDTMRSVLERQIAQSVDLRLKSGEKLGGKVVKVTEQLAQLTQLTGAEYFDAVVAVEEIVAVAVRGKAP